MKPPPPESVPPPEDRSLTLEVEDLAGVQRVVGLLRGRRYDLRYLHAEPGPDGVWVVELVVQDDAPGAQRLRDRLDRLVPVVDCRPSGHHVTAGRLKSRAEE